ncbi:MAG: HlyD family type I secretion periplasmic adaptor subunit [Aquabacterium sp.]|uniref:HlyD family type I secretion periplasmic adaptor subunit n=1 Tax=Aquabacterium sp. TaxID=1872578 RepID=UPI003BBFA577
MPSREDRVSGRYVKGDGAFLSGLKEAELAEISPSASWAIYLMLLAVIITIVWAALARVDEVTRVDGKVVPDGREQNIASLEGGILRSLAVREGALVEKGQELLQLDPTRVEAQQNEGVAKRLALKATLARLEAESTGRALKFPPDVTADQELVNGETEVYNARRRALDEGVGAIRRSLSLLNREVFMSERMSAKGLISEVEVMRLHRQANDMQLQIQERVNRFRQDASTELVRVRSELAQLEEQIVVKHDVLQRTTLYSPVRGLVKNIKLGTVGGVVPGGATIMEIVPVGDRVLVEARIKPADIGFVRVGLPAEVKLSAYDYYTYGGLKGTVEYISPDALGEESKTAAQDNTYYRALIRSEVSTLKAKGKPLSVMPGMTATIEIRTGERSVLQFLLKPVLKSQEAFRER